MRYHPKAVIPHPKLQQPAFSNEQSRMLRDLRFAPSGRPREAWIDSLLTLPHVFFKVFSQEKWELNMALMLSCRLSGKRNGTLKPL